MTCDNCNDKAVYHFAKNKINLCPYCFLTGLKEGLEKDLEEKVTFTQAQKNRIQKMCNEVAWECSEDTSIKILISNKIREL